MLAVALFVALAVPASPAPAGATPEERAAWRARLLWPVACESAHAQAVKILELRDGRLRAFPLDGRRTLVEVACARGSYQDSLLYYLWDETRQPAEASALRVPTLEAVDDEWLARESLETAGASRFDAARRTLVLTTLARGLGDCGSIARYRVQGFKLVLEELRGRGCDGDPESAPAPDKWPRVFPKPK